MYRELVNTPGYARYVVALGLCLVAACSIEVKESPGRDAGCPDAADAGCPDGKTCVDMGKCPGCKDSGSCKDTGTCVKCGDSRPCVDLGKCATCPDHGPPDAAIKPDKAVLKILVDDTFADFSKGTLSESGAKIYVAKKGNVQLLDRLDLNGDGWLDLVFSNLRESTTKAVQKLNSFVYWGAPGTKFKPQPTGLPTFGARGAATADLNQDGFPDIIFCNSTDGKTGHINSYIYWGSSGGKYSATNRAGLPTIGALNVAVADLNRDGYLDIVFSNNYDDTSKELQINSFIYWGAAGAKYSKANITELPTIGADGVSVADMNLDGYLDIIFSHHYGKAGKCKVDSYIYWGSISGFSQGKYQPLPTLCARANSIADLNRDGYLDIIFSSHMNGPGTGQTYAVNSLIYWGSSYGFSKTNQHQLPTSAATGNSVADLNGDGHLDIIFSNLHDDSMKFPINSYIYWGASGGKYTVSSRTLLPTRGATGNLAADFDGDGSLDIVFSNAYCNIGPMMNSYLYWGSSSGYSTGKRAGLPTNVASDGITADPGSVYDRKPIQTFTSRILDTGSASPGFTKLAWKATVPKNTSLKLQLRSAASPVGLQSTTWRGPTSGTDHYKATGDSWSPVSKAHNGDRYIQYRATFSHDFGSTPVLDRVEVSYYP